MKQPRSTLLTVLCVLSFVGGIYGIVNGVIGLATADKAEAIRPELEKAREEIRQDAADSTADKEDARAARIAGKMMEEAGGMFTKDGIQKTAIIGIVSSLLTLVGAFLMFRLKAAGFYTYVVGKVIEIGAPFAIFGSGMLTGLSAAITGFFGLIFIVLYAFCLKEMRAMPETGDLNLN